MSGAKDLFKSLGRILPEDNKSNKKKVLYLGPGSFKEGIWQNRVKYILPDLFSAIQSEADIFVLTGAVPEFAKEGIKFLSEEYGVKFREAPTRKNENFIDFWRRHGAQFGTEINADVVTNFFGSVQFPAAVVAVAKEIKATSVIRVAGDEISSRIAMGKYEANDRKHKKDLRLEAGALNQASRIIVMSPWEKKRIDQVTKLPEKSNINIRGVDLQKFHSMEINCSKPTKFLFVGRKSFEKGYDIVEKAAELIRTRLPEIEFLFAGDFEEKTIANRKYLGFVETENLPSLYKKVDVLILCSRSEGMPQVLAEAMASGKASILSKHLFEEWLQVEEVSLFCDLDPNDLAQKIEYLFKTPGLAEKLGGNASRFSKNYFVKDIWAGKYKRTLLQLDGSSKSEVE